MRKLILSTVLMCGLFSSYAYAVTAIEYGSVAAAQQAAIAAAAAKAAASKSTVTPPPSTCSAADHAAKKC